MGLPEPRRRSASWSCFCVRRRARNAAEWRRRRGLYGMRSLGQAVLLDAGFSLAREPEGTDRSRRQKDTTPCCRRSEQQPRILAARLHLAKPIRRRGHTDTKPGRCCYACVDGRRSTGTVHCESDTLRPRATQTAAACRAAGLRPRSRASPRAGGPSPGAPRAWRTRRARWPPPRRGSGRHSVSSSEQHTAAEHVSCTGMER